MAKRHACFALCLAFACVGCAAGSDDTGSTAAGPSTGGSTAADANPSSGGSTASGGGSTGSGGNAAGGTGATGGGAAGSGGQAGAPATGDCETIEDFDDGVWPRLPWQQEGGGKSGVSPSAAHDGGYGLTESEWTIDQFVKVGLPGDVLSAWVRSAGVGRAYLGFGSNPKGTRAVVFAANASSLLLNDVPGFYTFDDVATAPTGSLLGNWYRLEVEFGTGGHVTGRLYEANGTTLTASVEYSFPNLEPGGIAIRAFNQTYIDTIRVCHAP